MTRHLSHRGGRAGLRLAICLSAAFAASQAPGQLPYVESFETEGEPDRFTTVGRGSIVVPDVGPGVWDISTNAEAIGLNPIAPAKRAAILWSHDVDPSLITPDAFDVWDALVDWALDGKQNANIAYFENSQNAADSAVLDRLELELGHTVTLYAGTAAAPAVGEADLIIHSSAAGIDPPTKFNDLAIPLIAYNGGNHDDIAISSIGASFSFDDPQVTINPDAEGHPIAAGKTGTIPWLTDPGPMQSIGTNLPPDAQVIATYSRTTAATVSDLAGLEAMIDGSRPSTTATSQIDVADLAAGAAGSWTFDNVVPGAATGGFGVQGLGSFNVSAAGTFSFTLGGDDGGRLRIDLNRDGTLDAADDVIVDNAQHAFQNIFADVAFDEPGDYAFEWLSFNTGGGYGSEVSVSILPGGGFGAPVDNLDWETLGDQLLNNTISLSGPIDITAYYPDEDPVTEILPALVVVDAGGELLGGFNPTPDGAAYWVGGDLNADFGGGVFSETNPRILTLQPIDVAGQENVQMTVAVAGTNLDFEAPDFFTIEIDIDGDGPGGFQTLSNFQPVGGGAIGDGTTVLGPEFVDLTYDIPADATDLIVRFVAYNTFPNEIVAIDNIRVFVIEDCITGDYNCDKTVDLVDFNILKDNFGGPDDVFLAAKGSSNEDGVIDLLDFNDLKANFGNSAAVPEPGAIAMALAAAGVAICVFRTKRYT